MYSWLSLLGNFISVDNYAQHRGYLAQALHRKTIFQWSPNSCQEIYIISNQQCVKHTRFLEIILCSHLLSCLHKHLRFPLMKSKLFWLFHQNEDSNSTLLSSVHCWNSEVCILTSILWIDKIPWTVSTASPRLHFHLMEILLASMHQLLV